MLRQPIVSVLGHVDHGKTSLLDQIRGSAIAAKEAGGITQAIGASIIPADTIKKICGKLLQVANVKFFMPGILIIDTPGHAAFMNMRKHGGNLADIAILVIDINEGIMPQTQESIEILKSYKTPFIIAANKIDLIPQWQLHKKSIIESINLQSQAAIITVETKIYEIVGKLYDLGLQADRFDRVSDYTKQIAIIPISAKTGEGIPELLMVMAGLTQKYLEQTLQVNVEGPAKGTVLEVKEQKGLGKVLDVIIYDGKLKVNDKIIIGALDEPVVTKVKILLEPEPLAEMRVKSPFKTVKEVTASTGVRIAAPGIDNVIGGVPIFVVSNSVEDLQRQIKEEMGEVLFENAEKGVVIKADSLGSLEALLLLLKQKNIPVKKASIGSITKKDIVDAEAMLEKEPIFAAILGFNISRPDQEPEKVKVLTNDVIYRLIETYEEWSEGKKKNLELEKIETLTRPCKIQLLQGYVFRQNNPAVVGVEVILGTLKSNTPLMNKQGNIITTVKGIQHEQENIEKAERGKKVAISLPGVTIGRQLHEGDILYSAITENEFRKYKEFKQYLTNDEKELLKEIAQFMREKNAVWGV
ncbi:translation initiation factor IF-2 [Candidatus Woesearchaeota archaeon]|nr:translation initiation factor IF-2 [Candidatus Woesearchaeota archaeon]